MDERTLGWYREHAEATAARYEETRGAGRRFAQAFAPGSRVLDVGAGSGRDLELLRERGHDAYGLEPVEELRRIAVRRHPELAARLRAGGLPDGMPAPAELGGPFDGILCSAVLQHVPRASLFDAVFALRALLRPRGRVLLSFPLARAGLDEEFRDAGGRLFTPLVPGEIELLFERAGFASIGAWTDDDELGRPGVSWSTHLFELRHDAGSRPLDLIEGVLSRDRKVATYKLALLRALCDVALTQQQRVRWRGDGRVAVPVDAVAERWVRYYWPLFEARVFLPQMNGEWTARRHQLGFARQLRALMDCYRGRGGLTAFAVDARSGALTGDAKKRRRALLGRLRAVIREGPVTHAGGSLATGRLFDYDGGSILVDGALWRETSLMGHWIRDALVLRWADLVHRFARGEVAKEKIVAHLLREPEPAREQQAARAIYRDVVPLSCVWTDRRIRSFDVDHVLPFSLWRNNDLWNLLPAAPAVNRGKGDRLPTRALLRRRRGAILGCWERTRARSPARFGAEAAALTGTDDPAPMRLFTVVLECVETTALQRGCERWEP